MGGDEYVWGTDDAHSGVESFILLEDFGSDATGRENLRKRSEGQAGGGGEGFVRILHDGAGEGGRFETGRADDAVWEPTGFTRGSADFFVRKLDRPLRDGSHVSAVERDSAAAGRATETGELQLQVAKLRVPR